MGLVKKTVGLGLFGVSAFAGFQSQEFREFVSRCDMSEYGFPDEVHQAKVLQESYMCDVAHPGCDSSNSLVTWVSEGNVIPKPLSYFSEHLLNAIVSTEDRGLYTRDSESEVGLYSRIFPRWAINSLKGIYERRGIADMTGGSSIPMQTARTIFSESVPADTHCRKYWELGMSELMHQAYAVDSDGDGQNEGMHIIAERYVNFIYFGRNAYGFEAASQAYFGKTSSDLSIIESAIIAGLPQSPSIMEGSENPERDAEQMGRLQERADEVLQNMAKGAYDENVIAKAREELAANGIKYYVKQYSVTEVTTNYRTIYNGANELNARHYTDMVTQLVMSRLGQMGLNEETFRYGVRINTTLDPTIQASTVNAIENVAWPRDGRQIGAVVLGQDGEILAMYGGDYSQSQVNLTTSPAQVGSSLKPHAFAAAMELGAISGMDQVFQEEANFVWGDYDTSGQIYNVDEGSHCNDPNHCTGYEALAKSSNMIPLQIMRSMGQAGLDGMAQTMRNYYMNSDSQSYPSMVLGSWETSPLSLAAGINGLVANQGVAHQPYAVHSVTQMQEGEEVRIDNGLFAPEEPRRVNSPEVASQITEAMRGTVRDGTATRSIGDIATDTASKTGSVPGNAGAYITGTSAVSFGNITISIAMRHVDGAINMGPGTVGGNFPALIYGEIVEPYIDNYRNIN